MYAIRADSAFLVKYEFIRMPDSTGFGDYTESGQVIPVSFRGEKGGYVHSMYLDCDPPIAGGRELWGFPKKLASPILKVEKDTLGGALRFGPVPVADLPVLEVLSATHILCDLTLNLGTVVYDYLNTERRKS
jgi:acetoacetate decarboxylase